MSVEQHHSELINATEDRKLLKHVMAGVVRRSRRKSRSPFNVITGQVVSSTRRHRVAATSCTLSRRAFTEPKVHAVSQSTSCTIVISTIAGISPSSSWPNDTEQSCWCCRRLIKQLRSATYEWHGNTFIKGVNSTFDLVTVECWRLQDTWGRRNSKTTSVNSFYWKKSISYPDTQQPYWPWHRGIRFRLETFVIQYNTIQYKTCNAPTRMLFVGAGMTRD